MLRPHLCFLTALFEPWVAPVPSPDIQLDIEILGEVFVFLYVFLVLLRDFDASLSYLSQVIGGGEDVDAVCTFGEALAAPSVPQAVPCGVELPGSHPDSWMYSLPT